MPSILLTRLTPLALLAGLSLPAQAPNFTPSLTDVDEVRIGHSLAKQLADHEGMQPTPQSRKLDEYLQAVGDRVAAHAQRKISYEFHFDPNPKFRSAVGLPGGQVFVGAGILAYMDTEDQLAIVLGHEIEHIDLNQCRHRLLKLMTEKHLTASDIDKIEVPAFMNGYGHDGEFAADREGVKLAMQAGYSADAAVRLLQTFIILGEQMPNTPKEAKDNLQHRIDQIKAASAASNLPKPINEKPLALP